MEATNRDRRGLEAKRVGNNTRRRRRRGGRRSKHRRRRGGGGGRRSKHRRPLHSQSRRRDGIDQVNPIGCDLFLCLEKVVLPLDLRLEKVILCHLRDIQLIKKLLLRRGEVVGHVGHGTKRQRRRDSSCSTHGFTVVSQLNTVLSLNRPNDVSRLTSQLLRGDHGVLSGWERL
jgi:hypothetical protein